MITVGNASSRTLGGDDMDFDLYDYDNNRNFIFKSKASELYYFDEYTIIDGDGNVELTNADVGLTFREVSKLDGAKSFLANIEHRINEAYI